MISTDIILQTDKYKLRIPDETDIDFVFSATQHPDFNKGMQWDAPKNKDELLIPLENNKRDWVQGKGYSFTILSKEKSESRIGRISIRKTEKIDVWDVGFWTHPEHQRNGVMSEVLGNIVEFGFTRLKATKIRARYAIWNKASEKVLINNGFKFVKHIEKGFKKKNEWICENEFSISKQQLQKQGLSNKYCNFCGILKNNQNTIFETEQFVVILDIDPISLGHVIICPKSHYNDFHEMPTILIQEMMVLAKKYICSLQSIFLIKGYSMMLNAGEFNDLNHCHLHLFPRDSKEEFQWVFSEENLSKDATRFEILKKLIDGNM